MTTNKRMSKKKLSGHEQVVAYMNNLEHPFKREIEEIRTIVLHAHQNMTEHIKWNAPSFCIGGEDRFTLNLHGKGFVRLVFHCGSKGNGSTREGPIIKDDNKILEWITGDRAVVTFTGMSDVHSKREHLTKVIAEWIEATSNQSLSHKVEAD